MKNWTEEKLWRMTVSDLPDTRDRAHTEIIRRLQERVANLQAAKSAAQKTFGGRFEALEEELKLHDQMLNLHNDYWTGAIDNPLGVKI